MNQSPRVAYLYHSRILFIPLVGTILYKLQLYLFEKGLVNIVYVSRKENKLRDKLLSGISNKTNYVVCRSVKIGRIFEKVKSEKILDVDNTNYSKLTQEENYSLMWTLTFSDSITTETKKSLNDFIPENFPIKKTIIIPYNDSFDVVCDYIFQTAKILANQGNIVYLVTIGNPISMLKYLFGRNQREKASRQNFFADNNIIVVQPPTLFPFRLLKIKLIATINKRYTLFYITRFIKFIRSDLIWCFDPADIELVKHLHKSVTTIYDCVDYFSTLDQDINKKIQRDEKSLLKHVDFFFVNSHALRIAKSQIRKPDSVVPQGFDLDTFTSEGLLTNQEKREVQTLEKIFRKIPKPIVGFIGNLTYRLDFKLLNSIITALPKVSFVFTDAFLPMPQDDKFVSTEALIKQIKQLKNAYLIPKTISRKVVKRIIKEFDIGMIPYDTSYDFNKYCYPMKLFEYFYIGIPVISTPIEELKRFSKFVKIGNDYKEWKSHIKYLLSQPWPHNYHKEQLKLAAKNSWNNKVSQILKFVLNNH